MAEPFYLDTQSLASVQVHVDGPWELTEFGAFIEAMHASYSILWAAHLYLENRHSNGLEFRTESLLPRQAPPSKSRRNGPSLEDLVNSILNDPKSLRTQPLPDERIYLVAAQFASPGICEFLGLRQLIVRLRDLCHVATNYETARREIEIDRSRVELERSKLSLVRERMQLYRDALDLPLPEVEKRLVLKAITSSLYPIEVAAARGLLKAATLE